MAIQTLYDAVDELTLTEAVEAPITIKLVGYMPGMTLYKVVSADEKCLALLETKLYPSGAVVLLVALQPFIAWRSQVYPIYQAKGFDHDIVTKFFSLVAPLNG